MRTWAFWMMLAVGMSAAWAQEPTTEATSDDAPLEGPPIERLRAALATAENAETSPFTELEIALITSGVETDAALAQAKADYEAVMERLVATNVRGDSPSRTARALHKALFNFLKREDQVFDLKRTIDEGVYSSLTATFLYIDLSQRRGLDFGDYAKEQDGLSTYFLSQDRGGLRAIAAAMLAESAVLENQDPVKAYAMMQDSRLLLDESDYGSGVIDVKLYNRALVAYNEDDLGRAAYLLLAGVTRYPALTQFGALSNNVGIKMFQASIASGNFAEAARFGDMLLPHTGQYQAGFRRALQTVYYNLGVVSYQNGDFEASLEALDKSTPEQEGYRDVRVAVLEELIEKAYKSDAQDALTNYLSQLQETDTQAATNVQNRLGQMRLQTLNASGEYETALRLAAQNLSDEVGINNYIAVLNNMVRAKRAEGLEAALSVIDAAPAAVMDRADVNNLRYNTYVYMLRPLAEDDYDQAIAIYTQLFEDDKLLLNEEDRSNLRQGYGNAYYFKIERMIETRTFAEADALSRQIIDQFSEHKALVDQRSRLDEIMKRVGE